MIKNEKNDCQECEEQLAQCKESKCKQCEEDKKGAFILIKDLEKKVFILTVVVVIAITLIGKEFADQIISSLSTLEQIEDSTKSIIEPKTEENGETREVSVNDIDSSIVFFGMDRKEEV